ncbi:MAG TPA: glycoside hydrolase/phage tail family protein, partial [Propylenella sp.]
RLSDLGVQASTEGAVIPRVYGRARLSGQIIWATDYEEEEKTEGGGKGGPGVSTTEYSYFANFAVGLCEGPVARLGRIWADGKPLDQSAFTFRLHKGGEGQDADSLILAKEAGDAPAYRGTAYVVFERMPLADFGNRIPQLSFEVFRPVAGIEEHVKAVCIIPGSTEFGYDPLPVARLGGPGETLAENVHVLRDVADWTVSIDELQALCPNLEWVTLVVAWFGDDLRAGSCTIRPKVDDPDKATEGATWEVAGLTRAEAMQVSLVDERPAYGGTPNDLSVVRAIADLKARGLKVVLAPFILMDVPAGNALPDPETGETGQPAYPWRGRITCHPAPGQPGTPDKTAAASVTVGVFLGAAAPEDFSVDAGGVSYSGPDEWSYRRMVLHYAHLSTLAGGVDAFLIGSELRGLTTLRSATSTYPFVGGLVTLAADVRTVVGAGAAISYAADWSEYFGHQPADGSADVHFHLDPLWADAEIDFVGIDLYHPLTDWRDEPGHADEAGGRSPYDLAYLTANVRGGEGFDWYYASAADRASQTRTPIADGAYGKPWVFRFKDIEAWWANFHHDRPGGVELATPTDWEPESKPVWFTELGCPAIDKGANQPNVFFDPKSAESFFPYFSSGSRDDFQSRVYLDAYQRFFDPAHPDFVGSNPVSPVYGGRMVDPEHLHLWCWDARPFPHFPGLTEVWSDGENWERGHWLNGRFGAATLAGLLDAVMADHDFADHAIADVHGQIGGYLVNEVLSARATLEPLLRAFRIDAADAGDRVLFRGRRRPDDAALLPETLAERAEEPATRRRRAQETELPTELVLRFIDAGQDYRLATAASRRLAGESRRVSTIDLSGVLELPEAERLTDALLHAIWAGREGLELGLPKSALAIDAGDLLSLSGGARPERLLVERIEDGEARILQLRRVDPRGPAPLRPPNRRPPRPVTSWGPPEVRIIDFAPPDGAEPHAPRLAMFADPWPGAVAVYRATEGGGFHAIARLTRRATIGSLVEPLGSGPPGIFDRGNAIEVELFGGALAGLPDIDVLAGGNAAAVRSASGAWEVLQFANAELVGPRRYRLTRLLRGQCGTEAAMTADAAADFVLLDRAIVPLPIKTDQLGLPLRYRFGPAQDDHAAPSFAELTVAAEGVGLRPFAPVHLRAARDAASGDIELQWIRRTRFGGTGWAQSDVPLNEESEAYRLEVRDGPELLRSVDVGSPAFSYTIGDQAADFGAAAPAFTLRVAQLSATAGAGFQLEAMVDV